jgi:hypothetical protein
VTKQLYKFACFRKGCRIGQPFLVLSVLRDLREEFDRWKPNQLWEVIIGRRRVVYDTPSNMG